MARRIKNIIGKKFGFLTVIDQIDCLGRVKLKCKCICGQCLDVLYCDLQNGYKKSCGKCFSNSEVTKFFEGINDFCKSYLSKIVGRRFGRLLVTEKLDNDYCKCLCSCGKECIIKISNLHNNLSKSCGCLREDKARETRTTHGLTNTRLFRIWTGMKDRCYNKNNKSYHCYGAIGVTICEEWLNSFESFYNWAVQSDYSKDLSIDRINPYGNYEPSNCRWATAKVQANNTRKAWDKKHKSQTYKSS